MQKMVFRILEQQKAIHEALQGNRLLYQHDKTYKHVLKSFEATLETLSGFTDMLSAENFATISAILPVIHHIATKE